MHQYLYCLNDPVNRIDPSGLYGVYDDAAFVAAGAVCGLVGQIISDFIAGEFSGPEAYFGSIIGGAAGGLAALYTGGVTAGAVAGAISSSVTQWLQGGDFDTSEVVFSAGLGAITGGLGGKLVPKVNGITSGRGSYGQVTKLIITNFRKGSITKTSASTFGKIVGYNLTVWAMTTLMYGVGDGVHRRI